MSLPQADVLHHVRGVLDVLLMLLDVVLQVPNSLHSLESVAWSHVL